MSEQKRAANILKVSCLGTFELKRHRPRGMPGLAVVTKVPTDCGRELESPGQLLFIDLEFDLRRGIVCITGGEDWIEYCAKRSFLREVSDAPEHSPACSGRR
jgi:hypothetical protein